MIPNCLGCETEWDMLCDYVEEGLHFATTKKSVGIGERRHLFIIIVDDNGKVIVS